MALFKTEQIKTFSFNSKIFHNIVLYVYIVDIVNPRNII